MIRVFLREPTIRELIESLELAEKYHPPAHDKAVLVNEKGQYFNELVIWSDESTRMLFIQCRIVPGEGS